MSDISPFGDAWKSVRASLIIAGALVCGGLVLAFANNKGFISDETMVRAAMVLVGLGLAAVGDLIPKRPDGPPPPTLQLAALRQSMMRKAGWAITLGGLLFAGLWAYAPLNVAAVVAAIALGASMLVGSVASPCGFSLITVHFAARRGFPTRSR